MRLADLKRFLFSATARLAGSYLLIIMLMSIGFSLIFYHASSAQLGRQYPPDYLLHPQSNSDFGENGLVYGGDLDDFLQTRIDEGRAVLKYRLLYVNLAALFLGSVVSYFLARRTLQPIEDAMEAQIHFVNDASHELRTPLTAIQAGNEVALRNPKLNLQQAKQVITQNSQDIAHLKALSEGLLALAKNDKAELKLAPVALQDIVGHAMSQIVNQASAKRISVHDEVANVKVLANKTALEQVIVILLDNAVKYSHKKGIIYLRTRQKGKTLWLSVIDEGAGIRPSDLPHLFQRFYRADHSRTINQAAGYGLGLSIAERLMRNQGGIITVTSKLHRGSTFALKLKVA